MSSIATNLGLDGSSNKGNLAPYYMIFHFFWAYVVLSTRPAKNYLKIDHNVNPRSDIIKYGERAVADGKMTKRQLNFLQRNEACHANSMENFPLFVAAAVFATIAGVKPALINTNCMAYTMARIVYAFSYLTVESYALSYTRSLSWWAANVFCLRMLWAAGNAFNAAS